MALFKMVFYMITVFYDGQCPLCRAFKARHEKGTPALEWVDVAAHPERLTAFGYSAEDGLRAIHALDNNGKMHVGIDVLILVWKTSVWTWPLAFLIGLPIIKPVASLCYHGVAKTRVREE